MTAVVVPQPPQPLPPVQAVQALRPVEPVRPLTAIRPAHPSDIDALERMFARLSEQTLYRRFLSPGKSGPRMELAYLRTPEGPDRRVLVAQVGDELVGLARYHRDRTGGAEVALLVEDSWQGKGVGTDLVRALARAARADEVAAFTMTMSADNGPARQLFHRLARGSKLRPDGPVLEGRVGLAKAG